MNRARMLNSAPSRAFRKDFVLLGTNHYGAVCHVAARIVRASAHTVMCCVGASQLTIA
jgi:hypothetical protein